MQIEQIQYTVDVHHLGSFTKAAEKNNITVSAISISIKRLEKELNCQLFIRSNKRVSLSKDGHKVIPYLESILKEIHLLEKAVQRHQLSGKEIISIATTPGITDSILDYFNDTIDEPIHWQIIEGSAEESIKRVNSKQAQVGFLLSNDPVKDPTLNWEHIGQEAIVFITSKCAPEMDCDDIEGWMSKFPLALYNELGIDKFLSETFSYDYASTILLKTNNINALIRMLRTENALTIATPAIVHSFSPEVLDKLTVHTLPAELSGFSSLWKVTHKTVSLSPGLDEFIKYVIKQWQQANTVSFYSETSN